MEILITVTGFLFSIIYLDSLGGIILSGNKYNSFFLRISFGVIILSIALTLLGFLGILTPGVILSLSSVSYLLMLSKIKTNLLKYLTNLKNLRLSNLRPFPLILFFIISIYLTIMAITTLTPPISRDALSYHLYLPKIYLKEGRIYTIPNNIYSFFPGYWEVLSAFLLGISNELLPKLFHLFSLILTLSLILKFLKLLLPEGENFNPGTASLIFVSTPVINLIATWAYLDIGFTFYCLLGLYLLIKFYRKEGKAFFYLSAFSTGFALGIKYLGWLWIFCLLFLFLEKETSFKKALNLYLKFLSLSILIASPFYLRNIFITKNPFYPFFYSIFDGKYLDPNKSTLIRLYFKSFGPGVGLKELLLLPYRLLFLADLGRPEYFDGKITFLYLLPLMRFFKKKRRPFPLRSIIYILIIYSLGWFNLSQQLRFLIPALALIAIISEFYLAELNNRLLKLVILISATFYLFYPINNFLNLKPWRFILGRERRKEFLTRNIKIYPLIDYLNKNLPPDSKIMLLDTGPIAYYFEREIFQESIFEDYTLGVKLKLSPSKLASYLKTNQIDFILINESFFKKYFLSDLDSATLRNFNDFKTEYLKPFYSYKDFMVYKLLNKGNDI